MTPRVHIQRKTGAVITTYRCTAVPRKGDQIRLEEGLFEVTGVRWEAFQNGGVVHVFVVVEAPKWEES